MGFSTPTSWTTKLQDGSLLGEFVEAINERYLQLGVAAVTGPSDWDIAQLTGSSWSTPGINWQQVQSWINNNCTSFVRTRDEVGDKITNFDGETATNIPLWTAADLWSYATDGESTTGPRRYTIHPLDGGTAAYGMIQAWDVHGDWIVADLQKAMKELVWLRPIASYDTTTDEAVDWQSGLHEADWATAKTACAENMTYDGEFIGTGRIRISTDGGYDADGADYYASAHHGSALLACRPSGSSSDAWAIKRAIDFYFMAIADELTGADATFNAQGCAYAVEDTWKLFETTAAFNPVDDGLGYDQAAIIDTTARAGGTSTDFPTNWCDEPTDGHRKVKGWQVRHAASFIPTGIQAVEKFDVTGGFEYV